MRNPRNERVKVNPPSRSREGQGEGLSKRSPRNNPSHAENGSSPNEPGFPHPSRKGEGDRTPERTCVLTRRKGGRDSLLRLALGPDGTVAPDVRARAPGRGAWISVGEAELDEAVASGKLKSALQRAFKTGDVTIPADLAGRTGQALRQAALDRIGMEARSGNLVNGSDRVETAARSGKVHLLLHAEDAGEDGRRKLDQAWRVGGGAPRGVIIPAGRTILSLALGRENVVHIALIEPAAAARVANALARWRAFIDPDAGHEGGDSASGPGSAEEVEGTE